MELFCPVTGLRIFTRPEWTNKKVSDTFIANFYIIGNSIIYSAPGGKADLTGVQNSTTLKAEIAQQISDGKGPYLQIQDYTNLKGSTQAGRSYFTKNANDDERLHSMVFCNLSNVLYIAVKIGYRFNTAAKDIHVTRYYKDAIKRALELCEQLGLKQDFLRPDYRIRIDDYEHTLTPIEIFSEDAWDIQTPEISTQTVTIDKCILHTKTEGFLKPGHIPFFTEIRNKHRTALPKGSTIQYIVVDTSKLKVGDRVARTQYMQSLKEWHRQFPFRMYILYGVNAYLRTVVRLAGSFLPFQIKIAQDFEHAFKIIREDRLGNFTEKHKKHKKSGFSELTLVNIEKLLTFIGSINWEEEGATRRIDVSEDHPFYILYHSINLIKEELDDLFNERKKTEDALKNSNIQLQTALSELEQAQEKMVRQERLAAVGQLAAGIAHDFNNILTNILGFTELIQMSPGLPEPMQSGLEQINVSSQRAAHLVRQLLDFSRKTIPQPKQFDFASFTRETIKFIERTIPENIQIHLEIESGEYMVKADPSQMQQVITNLAINAKDAMTTGGELRIGLSREVSMDNSHCMLCNQHVEGDWVQLKIADTGSGIAADVLPHIFEPFFTTKEVGKGTGLGLSQVAGIVEQHQGHISVESQVEQGSTITIYLPVSLTSAEEIPEPKPTQINQGHGEIILLVEDEPVVLKVTTMLLERLNYQVITATNGENALSVFEKNKTNIALVLSDMMMPDMDGETLFRRLKTEHPQLKMVMMSGYPLGDMGAKLLEQGIVDWFQKPITFKKLSQVLDKALSN